MPKKEVMERSKLKRQAEKHIIINNNNNKLLDRLVENFFYEAWMLKRCEVGEALHKAIRENRGGQLLGSGTRHHFVVVCPRYVNTI